MGNNLIQDESNLLSAMPVYSGTYSDTGIARPAANLSTTTVQPMSINFSRLDMHQVVREHMANQSFLNPEVEVVIIVAYSVLMTSGIVSNALVCFVVARQCARKHHHTGPSPRNLYIVNLAVADLALCLICMPLTLISLLQRSWTLGETLCKVAPVVQGANIMVSAGTITAIALDRYFTIVQTPRGQVTRTARCGVASSIAIIWGVSFLVMIPLMIYQDLEEFSIDSYVFFTVCLEKWPSPEAQGAYTIVISIVQFVIPVVVLSTIHSKISSYLRLHLTSAPVDSSCKRAKREWRRNRRTMMILSIIAIVFALSWLPMTAFSILAEFTPGILKPPSKLYLTFAFCHITAMTTAVSNPLMYGWLNTNFRREFRLFTSGSTQSRKQAKRRQAERLRRISQPQLTLVRQDRRTSTTCFTTVTSSNARRPSTTFTLLPQSAVDNI